MRLPCITYRIILAALLLVCSCSRGPDVAVNPDHGGGSETWGMRGVLVDENAALVEGAVVVLFSADSLADSTPLLIDTTDTAGMYSFDSTELTVAAAYNLAASYNSDELVAFINSIIYDSSGQELGTDTLRAPGKIAGNVLSHDSTHDGTLCYIPGTSYAAFTDDTGAFVLSAVPQGAYTLYYKRHGYLRAADTGVTVVSGQTTTLSTTTLQLDPANAPPAPSRLGAVYDSLTGIVLLTWQRVEVADLAGYEVFIDTAASGPVKISPPALSDTFFTDTTRIYSSDTAGVRLVYQVRAVDSSNNAGLYSSPVHVTAYARQAPDTWSEAAPLTIARRYASGVAVDSLFYVIGGERDESFGMGWDYEAQNAVEALNTHTGQWSACASLPVKRFQTAAVTVGGAILVFGGRNWEQGAIERVDSYNVAQDTWDSIAALPEPRFGAAAVCVGAHVYVIGGVVGGQPTASILKFDPSTTGWTEMAPLQTPRCFHEAVVIDSQVYVVGGLGVNNAALSEVELFVPAANTVTASVPLLEARFSFAACASAGKIYVFGGRCSADTRSGVLSSVEQFDPSSGQWNARRAMAQKRYAMAAAALRGPVYVAGGTTASSDTLQLSTVEVYQP